MRKLDIRIGTKPSKDDIMSSSEWDVGDVINVIISLFVIADLIFEFMSKDVLRLLFVTYWCLIPGISISYRKEDDNERE